MVLSTLMMDAKSS